MPSYDYSLAESHPAYGARLTQDVFGQLCEQGYAILPDYLPQVQVAQMRAALESAMPPWRERVAADTAEALQSQTDVAGDNGARQRPSRDTCWFPYTEQILNHAIVNDPEAISFAARWLGTEDLHYRPGLGLASYPGFDTSDSGHIDNGNNSLLPPAPHDRRHSQLVFWFYLSDVDEGCGPTLFWPTEISEEEGPVRRSQDPEAFVGKAGSLCIFTNYTFHAASPFTNKQGERYVWKHAWGRADYHWEGTAHYTMLGASPALREFIPQISPRQREYLRFPPLGHDYYDRGTLLALERAYPGFDAEGEYAAAAAAAAEKGACRDSQPLPFAAEARL